MSVMQAAAERYSWIEQWLAQQLLGYSVDVLNREFVDAYAEATGAPVQVMPYGADKCRQLGRDLSWMAAQGRLLRCRTGLCGMAGMGFPRWVWTYRLAGAQR
ncbi:hypothetical protein [Acidovorax sp. BLS4]|uniref:hypothetical protein n=1 Tax=Acidovorax sp. BLS4 TaxID=3273430 RepID=UPI002943A4DC|nr:hypothetical protein [Paracidovorax avenae]WOI47704.1 hypothetical protein R1Z03_11025 [Paracidovorax avenae]